MSGRHIAIAAFIVIAICLVGLIVLRVSVRGEVYPNVAVYGVHVGGRSRVDAQQRIQARVDALTQAHVSLTYNGQQWSPTFVDLGLAVDIDDSVASAMAVGRTDGAGGMLRPLFGGAKVDIALPFTIDDQHLERIISNLQIEAPIRPVDASIAITGTSVSISPERDGQLIDRIRLKADLLAQAATGAPASVALVTVPAQATVRGDEIASAKAVIEQELTQPLVITSGGQSWTISATDLGRLVHIQIVDGSPVVALGQNEMTALSGSIAESLHKDATDAVIVDRSGIQHFTPSIDGQQVSADKLLAAIEDAFRAGSHQAQVPIDIVKPAKTTEGVYADLGIAELLATGTSDYSGSEPRRVTNIKVAASLIDGSLVPPGGEYSFNRSMGEILATDGFVPAGATENGIPGTSVGGGVCQVSTTVFRAALKAGMPIVERWPHTYRSPYYEQGDWTPGFDASILQLEGDWLGGSDFRFSNPTPGWLLLRTEIDANNVLKVMVYGPHTGYQVELNDPVYNDLTPSYGETSEVDPTMAPGTGFLYQEAMDGVTMTVGRSVFDADGNEILTDTFVSTYDPRGAIYLVGPES
ncbi:MAG: VanW family protein [Thermomicrobiales bacterium]